MATQPPEIPYGMPRIHRRFTHWRSAHPGVRRPIPPRLWKAAAQVALEHGVCRTAQVLRLEYGKLKRMAESDGVPVTVDSRKGRGMQRSTASLAAGAEVPTKKVRRTRSAASLPSFLEVVGSSAMAGSECVIELEGAQGRMRIQWKGIGAPDLAALGRVVLEPRTSRRWVGITISKTNCVSPFKPSALLPRSCRRSEREKSSKSGAWHQRIPVPTTCLCSSAGKAATWLSLCPN